MNQWGKKFCKGWHCFNWHCFNVSIFHQSIDKGNRAYNHWFLIASRGCWWSLQSEWKTIQSTLSLTLYLLPLILYPTNNIPGLTFPYKLVAWLDSHSKFSNLINYSYFSPLICLEELLSYHMMVIGALGQGVSTE